MKSGPDSPAAKPATARAGPAGRPASQSQTMLAISPDAGRVRRRPGAQVASPSDRARARTDKKNRVSAWTRPLGGSGIGEAAAPCLPVAPVVSGWRPCGKGRRNTLLYSSRGERNRRLLFSRLPPPLARRRATPPPAPDPGSRGQLA
ncbi:hypothetical protein PVAP13_7NG204034 [Panicum virgatum]|uniref:Uncharacterized protein n=1 Tax=Panicum virgatum TaxID=38727 RepID=A0A8T0Q7G9_PANVG|nr:hypothetical protein PVAP13_7NG204034 [Panicum virgatum]